MINTKKGFTLIELLVTIAIITLLSSIVFASVSSARDKASTRKAEVQSKEIEKAIELSRLTSSRELVPVNSSVASISLNEAAEDTGNTYSIIEELKEYLPKNSSGNVIIPEVDRRISDSSVSDGRDYFYISNGSQAQDSENWLYMCGTGEVPDYIVAWKSKKYKMIEMLGELYPYPVNDQKVPSEIMEGRSTMLFYDLAQSFRNGYFGAEPFVNDDGDDEPELPANYDYVFSSEYANNIKDENKIGLSHPTPPYWQDSDGYFYSYECKASF